MPKEKLQGSKDRKNNEFYTLLVDIENEVKNFWQQLEGKKIWCNCDDPEWSEFHHYFEAQKHFHKFEVKYTHYNLIPKNTKGWIKKRLDKPMFDRTDDGSFIKTRDVYVDEYGFCEGDFRSPKQDKLWKWADVIITNPPFALFREFIQKLMDEKKQFLIIGPQNAITYRDIFQNIKNNKLWLGYNYHMTGFWKIDEDGNKVYLDAKKPDGSVPRSCCWFTNLDTENRHRPITLCDWEEGKYIKYVNYDAYEVFHEYGVIRKSGTAEYPFTNKILAAPITFLQKYNPDQFEIIGLDPSDFTPTCNMKTIQLSGKLKGAITNNCKGTAFFIPKNKKDAKYKNLNKDEYYYSPFSRLFIRLTKKYYDKLKESF